jgi:ABC-2 type transport system permease protein
MMLVLYGFGIRYDVKQVPLTILDWDGSHEARRYIERFANSPYFQIQSSARSYADLQRDIDQGRARIGLVIPANFAERLGSNRQSGGAGYRRWLRQQHRDHRDELRHGDYDPAFAEHHHRTDWTAPGTGRNSRSARQSGAAHLVQSRPRERSVHRAGIIAIIMMIIGTVLTAVTIVKEKEQGTIEQIVSSPIRRYELMAGKVLPYAALAYLDFLLIIVASKCCLESRSRKSALLLIRSLLSDRVLGWGS